jgi:ricin-type beta-trefoil lectin protein
MRSRVLAVFLVVFSTACSSSITFQPAWSPVEFSLNTNGEISASYNEQFVTPLGTFTFGTGAEASLVGEDSETLLAINHYTNGEQVQTRYQLSTQAEEIKVCVSGHAEIFPDLKNNAVIVTATDLTTRITVVPRTDTCPTYTPPEYILTVEHSGKCLDLPSADPTDHVVLQQYACHGAANQRWRITHISDGYYTIASVASNKCLDVPSASGADGEVVQQFPCHNGPNQQWYIGPNNIVARHSGKCLDIRGGSMDDHAVAQQFTCHGGPNQRWSLTT